MVLGASGVCHSDYNAIDGTAPTRCPAVLGHEGAGTVAAVGAGVTRVRPGDRVMLSWMPACGRCDECVRGLEHLCARAWADMGHGGLLDGTPRLSRDGEPVFHYSFLSTFAEQTVVPAACCIPIPDDVGFDVAAIAGCAVATGHGRGVAHRGRAAGRPRRGVRLRRRGHERRARRGRGRRRPGDRGRRVGREDEPGAGARRDARRWPGRRAPRPRPPRSIAASGGGVDYAVEATGRPEAARAAFLSTRARGAAVLIGIPRADAVLELPALPIPRMERRVLGSIYGSSRPERDFPALLELYRRGRLPLDRLVTRRWGLDDVGTAFEAMHGGTQLRVVLDLEGEHEWTSWTGGSARRGRARCPTAATSTWCWRAAARPRRRRPRARWRRRGRGTCRSSPASRRASSCGRRRSWSTSRRSRARLGSGRSPGAPRSSGSRRACSTRWPTG